MKCDTARERLDVTRPNGSDRNDPDLQEEFAHLSSCNACDEVYEQRQAFDRRIAHAMQDVATPDGLQARILQSLEEAGEVTPAGEADKPAPTRRGWVKALVSTSAALVLLALALLFSGNNEPQPIAFSGLVAELGQQISDPDGFALGDLEVYVDPVNKTDIDGRLGVGAKAVPKGIDVDGDEKHDAAVFAISSPRGKTAYLVVVQASRVLHAPKNESWNGITPQGGQVPHVAWQDDGLVFVCFEDPAAPGTLRGLLRELSGSAA